MAGILHNVFSKGIYTLKDPDNVSKIKTLVNHSALYFGLIVYTAIGAKVFQLLELPAELEDKETNQALLLTERRLFLETLTNQTELGAEGLVSALEEYEEACARASGAGIDIVSKAVTRYVLSQDYSVNWDFIQSCFFCLTILTTIGYGNFAASTFGGRLFCLIFGMVGIPFMLSVLADVGGLMAEGIEYTWRANKERLRQTAEKLCIIKRRPEKSGMEEEERSLLEPGSFKSSLVTITATLTTLGLFFALGALLFTAWEDWTFFDAFYFCFITSTTIGFGDLTPAIGSPDRAVYMLLCTVYIMFGLAFTSTIIEIVRRQMVENLKKMQELKAQIQAQMKLAETLKRISDNAETNNLDLGLNLADDLEQLRNNLNKFKKSGMGADIDIDIEQLDWVENNKKCKAFFIYESSV